MIIVDTNVLARAIIADDPAQSVVAQKIIRQARSVAVPTHVLCELAWVLRSSYKRKPSEILTTLSMIFDNDHFTLDRRCVEAGLAALKAGGDFADGVIAFEGRKLGGRRFVTFDKQAAQVLSGQGVQTDVLSAQA